MFAIWVLRGLGGLLLLAAGLKMYGLAVEPIGRAGFFSQPWVQTALVEWEIFLGLWLIWGQYRAGAWLFATTTFLIFACFNFWQGWIGQGSCGCFGRLQVNPWLTFAIDLAALGTLISVLRNARIPCAMVGISGILRALLLSTAAVFAALGILAGIGTLTFGSPAAALAHLRGERISIDPSLVDVGDGTLGDQKEIVINVLNWSKNPIRIVGGTSDCSCVATRDLPLSIDAGATSPVRVYLTMKGNPGQFTRLVRLFVEDEPLQIVYFRVTGRIHAQTLAANFLHTF
jgi:uncharacterized protein DUF1573/methylamine utilization protein MauE